MQRNGILGRHFEPWSTLLGMTQCSADPACPFPAVQDSLCRQHLIDRRAERSLLGTCAAQLMIVAPVHVADAPASTKPFRCRTLAKKDGRMKLDADTVLWIRREAETQSQSSLARKYGVTVSTVSRILHRRRWKHF
jgi:hypothetical protein